MAESDHRSHRDPIAARSTPTPPRDQPDDPLAGLARLIGQSLITNDLPRDARRPAATGSRSAPEFNPPDQHGDAAPTDVLQETTEEQSSAREQGSYDFDPPNGTHDEGLCEALPRADVSPQSRSAWYEREPGAADQHIDSACPFHYVLFCAAWAKGKDEISRSQPGVSLCQEYRVSDPSLLICA